MSDVNNKPIRINKPDQILKILTLRLDGQSIHEIARKLHISAPAISQLESRIVREYPRILRFVEEIRRTGYFKMGRPYMRGLTRRTLPEGYKYVHGKSVVDVMTGPRIKEMFRLRIDEKLSKAEIGRRLKMHHSAILERLRNPYYANKKLVKGEWVDDDHEALVSFHDWKLAQRPIPGHNWDAVIAKRKQVKANNKNKILACLSSSEKSFPQVARETGLSRATAYKLLVQLQKEGVTDKNPPGRAKGKWRIKAA